MRYAVVLQNDALFNLLEKPGDGASHPHAATLVGIAIEALDLARPVDFVLDHGACGGHLLGFARALGARAVTGKKQARGCHRAYGVDYLAQGVWATPRY
jgi:hypothetical protein